MVETEDLGSSRCGSQRIVLDSGLDLLCAYEPPLVGRWYGITNLRKTAANGDSLMSWRSFGNMDAPGPPSVDADVDREIA